MNEADAPGLEFRLLSGLCFIVRKVQFIISWFFIVYVAGIATAKPCKLGDKTVLTTRRDVKHWSRHPSSLTSNGNESLNLT